MSQVLHGDSLVVVAGDSKAAVISSTLNDAATAINAELAAEPVMRAGISTGAIGVATGAIGVGHAVAEVVTLAYTGVAGTGIQSLDTNFATRVAAYVPASMWLIVGINDATILGTSIADYRTAYDSVMAKAVAAGIKIWALSILCKTEKWAAAPLRWAGPNDPPNTPPTIDDFNVEGKASVEAAGGVWVDSRAAGLLLEPTGNPGNANDGYLTSDGIHDSAAGKLVESNALLATIDVQVAP